MKSIFYPSFSYGFTLKYLITLYNYCCRPDNLPVSGLLTLEKFSISSNVVVNSPVSLLRFLVEDAALYLSDRHTNKSSTPIDINVHNGRPK